MKKAVIIFLTGLLLFSFTKPSFAVSTPTVTCLNPQGSIVVQYNSGTHGIVGRQDSYTGKDTVYKSSELDYLQCFCSDSGVGIQTNWVKSSQYTQDEVKILLNQGWIYVDSGNAWGLSDEPYYAKNSDFSCGGNGSSNSSSVGGISQGTSASLSNNSQGNSGLAYTGNMTQILEFLATGLLFTLLGIKLKKA